MKLKILQRACIWFCTQRHISIQEIVREITVAFPQDRVSERTIRRWWKDFNNGTRDRDSIDDKNRCGRPVSMRTEENVTLIMDLVMTDRHATVSELVEDSGIPRRTVHKILKKDLKLSKVVAKFVPCQLTKDPQNSNLSAMDGCSEWRQ